MTTEWRDEREEKPEHGAQVLVYDARSLQYDIAVYYAHGTAFQWDTALIDLTHWMPLPEAPDA